jgi:glyoxylase-like metal-dependent hydrolase (beta-lactamase superfamily II)
VLDEKTETVFAGDLIVTKHIPVLDGSVLGWLTALDALGRIPAKRVLPGHGPAVDDWHGALNQQRRYLEGLTRDMRALIARGTPLADAVAGAAAQDEKDQWSLFEDYHARNATSAFAELEWE